MHELHALYQAGAEKLGEYLHITREMFLFSVCFGGGDKVYYVLLDGSITDKRPDIMKREE